MQDGWSPLLLATEHCLGGGGAAEAQVQRLLERMLERGAEPEALQGSGVGLPTVGPETCGPKAHAAVDRKPAWRNCGSPSFRIAICQPPCLLACLQLCSMSALHKTALRHKDALSRLLIKSCPQLVAYKNEVNANQLADECTMACCAAACCCQVSSSGAGNGCSGSVVLCVAAPGTELFGCSMQAQQTALEMLKQCQVKQREEPPARQRRPILPTVPE